MELTGFQQGEVERCRANLARFLALPPRERGAQVPEYCGVFRVNVETLLDVIAQLTAEPLFVSAAETEDDVPEYEPDDAEAQRIAEVYADARAEMDRGL